MKDTWGLWARRAPELSLTSLGPGAHVGVHAVEEQLARQLRLAGGHLREGGGGNTQSSGCRSLDSDDH